MNINIFIKENVKNIGKNVYIAPNIPEKKLNRAIKAFKCEDFYESILAIYDDTIFKLADEGLVFTGEKMIYREAFSEPIVFKYSDIKSVKYIEDIKVDKKGKTKVNKRYTLIILKDGKEYRLSRPILGNFNHKKFVEFLNTIINEIDEYKEVDQLKPISEMPEPLKAAYLKIIINMTYMDDGVIDEKELAEIFLLMGRLNLSKDVRFDIRSYIGNISQDNIEPIEDLLETIKKYSDESLHKSIMISLVKDLINVYFSTKDTINENFEFLDKYKKLFNLKDEEIKLAYEAVKNDFELLKFDSNDDTIKKKAKELAAHAAAIGVPLTAVYISGSTVGLSFLGIISGLEALGLGLGMAGGLVVFGLIGVLSYKAAKRVTGISELEKFKYKELMLHEALKQTQKTISVLIEDINFLIKKLNEVINKHMEQEKKIKELIKLTHIITKYQKSMDILDKKSDHLNKVILRGRCPKILDIDRLKFLTSEPTKKSIYDFIIKNYELKVIPEGEKMVEKFVIKEDLSTDTLDKLVEAFEAINYFNFKNFLKSKIMK